MTRRRFPMSLCALGMLLTTASFPLAAEEVIHYRDWAQIKGAVSLLQLPALQRVVTEYENKENAKIIVRYPGGDLGNARAEDLRSWLVSLGISSRDIELHPGSGVPEGIVVSTATVP